ncbi:MAG: hypothetical protein AB9917_17525 [Negativicutes bacterium]
MNKEVVVIDFARTALLKPLTAFAKLTSQDLAAACIADLVRRTGLPKNAVQDVVFGQSIITTFPYNLARHSTVLAGLPVEVPGTTVQCIEASGLQALQNAYHLAVTENSEIVIAGGAESYSAAPYVMREARYSFDPAINKIVDTITEVELYSQPEPLKKSVLTQAIAKDKGYAPEQQYAEAARSFGKAIAAKQQGVWEKNITPVVIKDNKKCETIYAHDTFLISDEPTVTDYFGPVKADGACAMLIMTREEAEHYNFAPIARIKGVACAACASKDRWLSAVLAIEKLLKKTSLSVADIDLFEIREDSAAALLASTEALAQKADIDPVAMAERINPYGGTLAMGSSAGSDGTIIAGALILGLQNYNKKRGIVAASAAGGQGIAILIER